MRRKIDIKGHLIGLILGGTSEKTQSGKNVLEKKGHILSLEDWRNVQNARDICVWETSTKER